MPRSTPPEGQPDASIASAASSPGSRSSWKKWALRATFTVLAVGAAGLFLVAVAFAMAYPKLPDISDLRDYRPKLPLRIFAADGAVIGEFGEERRNLTPIAEIPKVMKDAVLAIEDARFYSHGGVDYRGLVRAAVANVGRVGSQGASTITMQVARNVYLTSEKTVTRKIYEILLTFKLEHMLSKDQILEIYMNQIFLGNRAYGFASASEIYFGKPLKALTIAEAAMLAGLPKAPSAYNPIANPRRARARQLHIIDRMVENEFITAAEGEAAKRQELKIRTGQENSRAYADFAAEAVRQLIFARYGEETYTRGLNVTTSIVASEQEAAYRALRKGIMDYEKRQVYRGPEKFYELPSTPKELEDAIDDALSDHPDNGDVFAAVVLEASPKRILAVRQNSERIEIVGEGLRAAQSGLSDRAGPKIKVSRGALIRVMQTPKNTWEITQLPEVEGAFVAMDPRSGDIRALVGGFDFQKNKFNHVTQAWRQPGSSFKPFIYSAALERGFTPTTVVNDSPLFFGSEVTGGQPWEPKNYDGKFEGPMPLHTALAKSKNMVSIRVLQAVGTQKAQEWISRFGFDADKHPPYLTMALGAGSVTPLQMATAYSVFANGGYRVNPQMILRITDQKGRVLAETPRTTLGPGNRAIDARNAFVMSRLLQEITRSGTAAAAQAKLKRTDLYGKTGTTNDSMDTWFAGYHPSLTAVVWMGFDNPRSLGDRETGGGLSLPVWINFMESALKRTAPSEVPPSDGVVNLGGEWYFEEFSRGGGVTSLGTGQEAPAEGATRAPVPLPAEERRGILDLFRN